MLEHEQHEVLGRDVALRRADVLAQLLERLYLREDVFRDWRCGLPHRGECRVIEAPDWRGVVVRVDVEIERDFGVGMIGEVPEELARAGLAGESGSLERRLVDPRSAGRGARRVLTLHLTPNHIK